MRIAAPVTLRSSANSLRLPRVLSTREYLEFPSRFPRGGRRFTRAATPGTYRRIGADVCASVRGGVCSVLTARSVGAGLWVRPTLRVGRAALCRDAGCAATEEGSGRYTAVEGAGTASRGAYAATEKGYCAYLERCTTFFMKACPALPRQLPAANAADTRCALRTAALTDWPHPSVCRLSGERQACEDCASMEKADCKAIFNDIPVRSDRRSDARQRWVHGCRHDQPGQGDMQRRPRSDRR